MRSKDGGETWSDDGPGAQRDVRALAWHLRGGCDGTAWSRDRGKTWQPADAGRDRHYT